MILAANDIPYDETILESSLVSFIFERYCFILAYAITPYNWMYTPPKFYLSTSKSIGVGMDFEDCYHYHKCVIMHISKTIFSMDNV